MRSFSLMNSRLASSLLVRTFSRWVLGTAGILWVAIAASLCGCSPIAPVNGWVMNESGKAYYKRGDYRAARYEFERAYLDSPQNADYAYNVAAAMDQQGDDLAAEKMYRHALTLDPGHQPSYHGLAAMMIDSDRTNEASDLINTWAATQPYSAEAATELGWLKSEQGDTDGADREYRRALRQNPRHARARTELARLYGKTGRRGEAAAEYARSLFMDPNQPDAQAEMASLGQSVYGDPALQIAAAMPVFDSTMQPSPYPAFTSPAGQPQMANNYSGAPNWYSAAVPSPQMSFSPAASSGFAQNQSFGPTATMNNQMQMMPTQMMAGYEGAQTSPMPPAQWGQYPQQVTGAPTFATTPYPDIVPPTYPNTLSYSTARQNGSFFQPQQTFTATPPQGVASSPPVPMPEPDAQYSYGSSYPVSGNVIPVANNAPQWNPTLPAQPGMLPTANWSTPPSALNPLPPTAQPAAPIPAPQVSAVPVVPAF